ncbi:MAG: hypothetical protein RIF33_02770 [Cyclobacteriaceae bacterium]
MKKSFLYLTIALVVLSMQFSCTSSKNTSATGAEKKPEYQLTSTSYYGKETAIEVAKDRVDLLLQVVNGFAPAKTNGGDISNVKKLAHELYAKDALVFQSQPFIDSLEFGGKAFVHALDFINTELGLGEEFLEPKNVCAIYAFYPEKNASEIHWVMTTAAIVPKYGQVLNTVLMKAKKTGSDWKVTYHEYMAAPAGGEDCSGAQAQKVQEEWAAKVN